MWNYHSWPLDASTRGLPIWALTVEMWNCHSWPLDTYTRGVDMPVDLPIWALTVEMWNCHSWPLDALLGVDLPVDLPIWALTVEMWSHHSWPLDASMGGRYASWSTKFEHALRFMLCFTEVFSFLWKTNKLITPTIDIDCSYPSLLCMSVIPFIGETL